MNPAAYRFSGFQNNNKEYFLILEKGYYYVRCCFVMLFTVEHLKKNPKFLDNQFPKLFFLKIIIYTERKKGPNAEADKAS